MSPGQLWPYSAALLHLRRRWGVRPSPSLPQYRRPEDESRSSRLCNFRRF